MQRVKEEKAELEDWLQGTLSPPEGLSPLQTGNQVLGAHPMGTGLCESRWAWEDTCKEEVPSMEMSL